jgi:parallel beta-helix repeat protein
MFENFVLKKILVFGILTLFFGLSVLPTSGEILEKTQISGFPGNVLYVGGNGTGNYTRIQDAVDNAIDGDTVFVFDDSSPYHENVVINVSINLVGEDRSTTIIDGGGSGHVVVINSPGLYITEFTMRNSCGSIPGCAGIRVNSDDNYIYRNILTNNFYGLLIFSSSDNTILENIVSDNDFYGIYLSDSDSTFIHKNEVSGNEPIGIVLFGSSNNNISGNSLVSNNRAMDLYHSSYNDIFENIVENNFCGIYLGSSHGSTCYNTVNKNIVSNNEIGTGITLDGKVDGIISYNIVTENVVSNNARGIDLLSYTTENEIYHNNLIDNICYDIVYNGRDYGENIWDNGEEGNYWSDYEEEYPNARKNPLRPWVWNTPYELHPDEYNKDRYPLVKEWPESVSKTLPRNTLFNYQFRFLNKFFDLFPNAFPFFRYFLERINVLV